MRKEYVFEFFGTKEEFFYKLKQFRCDSVFAGKEIYSLDDYLVKIIDGDIQFGVAKSGHSYGYWFIPTVTELDDRIEFRGVIRHIGPNEKNGSFQKVIDTIEEILLMVLLLPVIIAFRIYLLVEWLVRKLCNRPKPKEKTTEDCLCDLMENYFGCVRKETV